MLALLDTPTRKLDMIMAVVDTAGILAGVAMEIGGFQGTSRA
jgi:hypothetical protein